MQINRHARATWIMVFLGVTPRSVYNQANCWDIGSVPVVGEHTRGWWLLLTGFVLNMTPRSQDKERAFVGDYTNATALR